MWRSPSRNHQEEAAKKSKYFIVHLHIVNNKTAESQITISLFGMKLRDVENAKF